MSRQRGKGVLVIVENLPVPFDRRVWAEARFLRDAGYEVSVICPKGRAATNSFEVLEGIEIWRHPLPFEARRILGYVVEYGAALFWELWLAAKVYRRRRFAVLQACNPPDLIFLVAAVFKWFCGVRFVFDHHDLGPELLEAKFGKQGLLWRAALLLERATFLLADVSIATNNSYRDVAVGRGGMPADKVFVVRSGPDLARIRTVPSDPAWRNGRAFLVAYVGVIGRQEGLDLLLEALSHIRDVRGRSDVQCVVVGDGPEAERIRLLARDMRLEDRVTFTGRVDDATLFSVLSTADVCVNPDVPNAMNDKSTMNKIMEYMALGKPIVQFDLTEGRFSAREASLYASDVNDFAEKILELLDDPVRRRAMGEYGKKRVVDELAWPHEAPKLLAAYEAAIADKSPTTATVPAPLRDV